jgi:hypothetical protein
LFGASSVGVIGQSGQLRGPGDLGVATPGSPGDTAQQRSFLVFMGKGLPVSANVKEQAFKNLLGEVVFHFTFHYNTKR